MPYGEAWLTDNTPSTNENKFTTYSRDTESGLDYAVKRYYGSKIGRFGSVDALSSSARVEESQTWNRYGYVKDDPINFSDPDGQDPVNIFERITELYGSSCTTGMDGFVHCPSPPESVLIVDPETKDANQQPQQAAGKGPRREAATLGPVNMCKDPAGAVARGVVVGATIGGIAGFWEIGPAGILPGVAVGALGGGLLGFWLCSLI